MIVNRSDILDNKEFVRHMKEVRDRDPNNLSEVVLEKEFRQFEMQREGRRLAEPIVNDLRKVLKRPDIDAGSLWKSGDGGVSSAANPEVVPVIVSHLCNPRSEYQTHYFSRLGSMLGEVTVRSLASELWEDLPARLRESMKLHPDSLAHARGRDAMLIALSSLKPLSKERVSSISDILLDSKYGEGRVFIVSKLTAKSDISRGILAELRDDPILGAEVIRRYPNLT